MLQLPRQLLPLHKFPFPESPSLPINASEALLCSQSHDTVLSHTASDITSFSFDGDPRCPTRDNHQPRGFSYSLHSFCQSISSINHPLEESKKLLCFAGRPVVQVLATTMIGATSYPLSFRVSLLVLLLHFGVAFLPFHHSSTRVIRNAIEFRRHMFTGIVEEIGTVKALEERDDILMWDGSTGKGTVMTVEASVAIKGAYPG
jgi:hypothetical protein